MADYLWTKRSDTANRMSFYGAARPGDDYDLHRGQPELATWSEEAYAEAQAHSKKKLEDFASTQGGAIICSPKAKKALDAYEPGLPHTEWLPLTLQSGSGKVLRKTQYYVLHVIDHLDVLDLEASGAKMNAILKTRVRRVKKLVLDLDAVPEDRQLFRLQNFPYTTFVSRELVDYIQKQKLTGIRFGELDEYNRNERF